VRDRLSFSDLHLQLRLGGDKLLYAGALNGLSKWACGAVDSAFGSGPKGRGFESLHARFDF
jgi:hypothetical protein